MKELSGRELAGFVKERQAGEVRRLRGAGVVPKLVIFYDNDSPVIEKYMDLKQVYGEDIGVEVERVKFGAANASSVLAETAKNQRVHGMIVQLPLVDVAEDILTQIPAEKDVDGLNGGMDSATAEAINWLLSGNGVELRGKKIALVGHGKLVGGPLAKMWGGSGYDVTVFGRGDDLSKLKGHDVIVSATGAPGLIKPEVVKSGAVVVDAGTASENGGLVGDVDDAVRGLDDVVITPKVGGVGPLTVAVLFEHVLRAANN
jgi:methylenetetrahydrofolate dehydrogenase (NADP+)/methenyltetrahydrofolate cyclohydrolase